MLDVGPLRLQDGAPGAARPSGVAGGVAVILDIPARGSATSPHHDRFEQVLERAPIRMGLLDLDGRWTLVNRAQCEITGYSPRN